MAYAATMKGQKFSSYVKKTYGGDARDSSSLTCYNYGKPGRMQKTTKSPTKQGKEELPDFVPDAKRESTKKININQNDIRTIPPSLRRKKRN